MVKRFEELIRESVCGPTDEKSVGELERRLGIRLPVQYRNFLLKYNGSFLDSDSSIRVSYGSMDDNLPLLCLFALCKERQTFTLEGHLDEYIEGSRIMQSFLPIGQDACDDMICLKIKGENTGRIYAWIFEEEAEPEDVEAENEAGWENMYFLANDFDEFIEKIVVEPFEFE